MNNEKNLNSYIKSANSALENESLFAEQEIRSLIDNKDKSIKSNKKFQKGVIMFSSILIILTGVYLSIVPGTDINETNTNTIDIANANNNSSELIVNATETNDKTYDISGDHKINNYNISVKKGRATIHSDKSSDEKTYDISGNHTFDKLKVSVKKGTATIHKNNEENAELPPQVVADGLQLVSDNSQDNEKPKTKAPAHKHIPANKPATIVVDGISMGSGISDDTGISEEPIEIDSMCLHTYNYKLGKTRTTLYSYPNDNNENKVIKEFAGENLEELNAIDLTNEILRPVTELEDGTFAFDLQNRVVSPNYIKYKRLDTIGITAEDIPTVVTQSYKVSKHDFYEVKYSKEMKHNNSFPAPVCINLLDGSYNNFVTILTDSPELYNNLPSFRDYMDHSLEASKVIDKLSYTEDAEQIDSINAELDRERLDMFQKLLPIRINFADNRMMLMWFVLDEKLIELLPEKYRDDLQQEYQVMKQLENNLSIEEACKGMTGESLLGICSMTDGALKNLQVSVSSNDQSALMQLKSTAPRNIKIMLFSMSGTLVKGFESKYPISAGTTEILLDVSDINNGVYFLAVTSDSGETLTAKILL